MVLGETGIEVSDEWEGAEAGEGIVPGVPAHLHHPGGEGGLGAGQLDGDQLPVHLQIHSHSKGPTELYLGPWGQSSYIETFHTVMTKTTMAIANLGQ